MIMLPNVNSEIYTFWLITTFANCTICINLWNAVGLQSGDAREMSPLGATQACRTRSKLSVAKERRPFLFLRNKLPIARDSLVHSAIVGFWMWILTAQTKVVYLKCYHGFLTTLDAQHTEPIRARSLFWGPYLTAATLHSSQRFGARRKKLPESTKSSKLHHFILDSLLNTAFCNKQEKLGTSGIIAPWSGIWHLQSTYPLFSYQGYYFCIIHCVYVFTFALSSS